MPPTSLAVVGHSYVRHMRDYVLGRPEWHNMDIPRAVANVSWVCAGGASVIPDIPHRSAYLMLPQLQSLAPDVVFIHLGENDLATLTGPALVAAIRAFINAVINSCHPRFIVVSQLTLFQCNNHLANRVRYVNAQLRHGCASFVGGTRVVYWKHRIGIWGPDRHHMYAGDGVHLSRTGLVRYCHSVRRALIRMTNQL